MILLRFKGVLTVEEKHLVNHDIGKELVKKMRQVLREMYSEDFKEIVEKHIGCKVLSSHSDTSTKTSERIKVFVMDKNIAKLFGSPKG
jgi:uncharacterized protein YbcI